jgi:hypothetical protein
MSLHFREIEFYCRLRQISQQEDEIQIIKETSFTVSGKINILAQVDAYIGTC